MVARTAEERAVGESDKLIVAEIGDLRFCTRAVVFVVCKSKGRVLITPYRVEGNVGAHLYLAAGVIGRTAAVCLGVPAEEHLVCGSSQAVGALNVGVCAIGIVLGIGNRTGTAVGVIGHGKPVAVGDDGVKRVVSGDLSIKTEGLAVLQSPAEQLLAFRDSKIGDGNHRLGNRALELYIFKCIEDGAVIGVVYCHGKGRLNPLRVDRDIVGGHGLACEVVLCGDGIIGVPAVEYVTFLACGRVNWRIAARAGNVRLKFEALGVNLLPAAHVYNIVAVAGVVEFGVSIAITNLCNHAGDVGKAGYRVTVFFTNGVTGSSLCFIGMMDYKPFTIELNRTSLVTVNGFNIISGGVRSAVV